ncbi:MAG: phage holin family protein [Bacteroidales bacterium]|nr:phage holin family protein [Bacteroidales bacterium]MCD8387583.1 phage holin family protein [Bacteroidales bacterium]
MNQKSDSPLKSLVDALARLVTLYIENARLTAAEKATMLISVFAIAMLALMLSVIVMIFLVMGIATLLESYIEPFWTYFIVAGVFILIIALIVLLRIPLIYNPVARFISKLLLTPPNQNQQKS